MQTAVGAQCKFQCSEKGEEGLVQGPLEQSPCSPTSRAETCRVSAPYTHFHCWEVSLISNPNTSSCRTSLGLSSSLRAPGLLRTGQSGAFRCWVRLTWHTRSVDRESQGGSLLCSAATGVGLPSSRWASVSAEVQWAGKDITKQSHYTTFWLAPGRMGTQTPCSKLTWPCPSGRHHFNSCLF